jgi:hypothetical protein
VAPALAWWRAWVDRLVIVSRQRPCQSGAGLLRLPVNDALGAADIDGVASRARHALGVDGVGFAVLHAARGLPGSTTTVPAAHRGRRARDCFPAISRNAERCSCARGQCAQ